MGNKGFSLIELIVVILIIGIMSAALIAGNASYIPAVRLEAARWRLKSDLSYAQSLAVTQQLNHGIIFNPPNSYSVYKQTTGNIVNNPLTGSVFTVNYLTDSSLKGVTISATSFGSPTTNRVEFDSSGSPSDGTLVLAVDGSVTLSNSGKSATITVTKNTGKIN